MQKIPLQKPILITSYGYPGSGKSYIARQMSEHFKMALVSIDKLRAELFDSPVFDTQENRLVGHLAMFMANEFLSSGVSVVFDGETFRSSQRRHLRELARKHKADFLLVWVQLDTDTALARTEKRDRRTADDKFAFQHSPETFNGYVQNMQNPQNENYVVVSGKHTFHTQKNTILNRLYELGAVHAQAVQGGVSKPGLINLVPKNQGRVDMSRRNILIR